MKVRQSETKERRTETKVRLAEMKVQQTETKVQHMEKDTINHILSVHGARRLMLTLLLVLSAHCGMGQVPLFTAAMDDDYERAVALNQRHQYLKAYTLMASLERQLDERLATQGLEPEDLGERDFGDYWAVKKSVAEIAYALGLHEGMSKRAVELSELLDCRYTFADTENSKAWHNHYLAEVLKIEADGYYLKGQYANAEKALLAALVLRSDDGSDFVYKTRDDLAQLYYKGGELLLGTSAGRFRSMDYFQQALYLIDAILAAPPFAANSRRGTDFLETDLERDRREILSQRALCLARLGRYAEAKAAIGDILTATPKREDRLAYAEALRKKAKIGMLEYDATGTYDPQIPNDYREYLRLTRNYVDENFVGMDEQQMAALVLGKKTKPAFVHIAPVSALTGHLLSNGMTVEETQTQGAISDRDALYSDSALSRLIWNEELVRHIGTSQHIYFAADGIFHQLAVEYLLPSSWTDKKLYRLTSTRLLAERRHSLSTDRMLLCGGIDFRLSDLGDVASSCENDQQAYQILAAKNIGLPYLDGSEQEVDSIALLRHVGTDSIALLRHVGTDCLLRGSEATESAVRQLMEHYNVLHFSTHGYCAEASNAGSDIRPMDSDTQLSQSCLFLAGAEHNLHTAAFDTSQPDGILSARELAGHDLSGVDLAVLSACQSGVGALTIDGILACSVG